MNRKNIDSRTILIIVIITLTVWMFTLMIIDIVKEKEIEKHKDKYFNEVHELLKDLDYEIECTDFIMNSQGFNKQCNASQNNKPSVIIRYYISSSAALDYYKLDDGKEEKRVGHNNIRILIKEVNTDSKDHIIHMYIENTTITIKGNNKEQKNNLIDSIVESLE